MAHWHLTPEQIKKVSSEDIALMEFSFLLYERRQSETLDNIIGMLIGASWDSESLLEKDKSGKKDEFTWALRKRRPKVIMPLALALNQNPKFMENLKSLATKTKNENREDPSMLNVPRQFDKQKTELVDLSNVSPKEFLKYARSVPGYNQE